MRMILICSQVPLFTLSLIGIPGPTTMAIWLFALHYHATANALADARLVLASNAGDSVRRAKALADQCSSTNPLVPAASPVHRPAQLPVLAPLLVARRSRKVRSKTFFHQSLVCCS